MLCVFAAPDDANSHDYVDLKLHPEGISLVPEVRGWPELEIGFKSAEVVVFPVSRHVLVYGANCRVKATNTTRKRIAAHNTFTMLTADKQVYSHVPGNCSRKRNSCRAPLPRPKNPDPEDKVYGPNQASKNR